MSLFSSLQQYRAYTRMRDIQHWLESTEVAQHIFADDINAANDLNIFLYQDEEGRPALEVQVNENQILILRYNALYQVKVYWTAALISYSADDANKRFFIDATLSAIEDINLCLEHGTVYLTLENGNYALRYVCNLAPPVFRNRRQFTQAFSALRQYFSVHVNLRYQQFMNHVAASQNRQQQEFDVD